MWHFFLSIESFSPAGGFMFGVKVGYGTSDWPIKMDLLGIFQLYSLFGVSGESCCHLSASHDVACCTNQAHIRQLWDKYNAALREFGSGWCKCFLFANCSCHVMNYDYCIVWCCIDTQQLQRLDLDHSNCTYLLTQLIKFLKSSKPSPLSPVFPSSKGEGIHLIHKHHLSNMATTTLLPRHFCKHIWFNMVQINDMGRESVQTQGNLS